MNLLNEEEELSDQDQDGKAINRSNDSEPMSKENEIGQNGRNKSESKLSFIVKRILILFIILSLIIMLFIIITKNNKINEINQKLKEFEIKFNKASTELLEVKNENYKLIKENKENNGEINPFYFYADEKNIKPDNITFYLDINNELYKILIFYEKINSFVVFIADQEENLSEYYYFRNITIPELQKISNSFRALAKGEEFINELRHIISQSLESYEDEDEDGDDNKNKVTLSFNKDTNKLFINFETYLVNDDKKEYFSIGLLEKQKYLKDLNLYLIDYIKQIKTVFNFRTLNDLVILSKIIANSNDLNFVTNYIKSEEKSNVYYRLIFQSSRDGDKEETFHELCDEITPILVLIKTKKNIVFGGYTTSLRNEEDYLYDNKAFVFSVDNQKIYKVKKDEFALNLNDNYLIGFGDERADVFWFKDRFLNKVYFTCDKRDSPYEGMETNFEINGGYEYYQIKELEVYEIYFDQKN